MFREDVLLYPVNPKQLARYCERYPGGVKNDPTDSMYLARMLRERSPSAIPLFEVSPAELPRIRRVCTTVLSVEQSDSRMDDSSTI